MAIAIIGADNFLGYLVPNQISPSIIVPTRNEADSIAHCLTRILNVYPDGEILVVDGGNDATEEVVARFSAASPNVIYVRNCGDRGKGHAIQTGISRATRDILVQIDGDLQFHPEEIPLLVGPIERSEADMVLGVRFAKRSQRVEGSTPWHRSLGNRLISLYTSLLFGQSFCDVLAGMKGWRREVTTSFALQSDSYSYEAELVAKAVRYGWRVAEAPITTEPRRAGQSSVRVVKVGMQLLRDITYFRLQPRTFA